MRAKNSAGVVQKKKRTQNSRGFKRAFKPSAQLEYVEIARDVLIC